MTETLVRHAAPPSLTKRHATRFNTRWTMTSVAILYAHGNIDATNASTLTDFALAQTGRCRGLILDLSGLEFIGTEGFSSLHRIAVSCARVGTVWIMVPSAAVSRLLQVCDPDGSLPAVDTVDAALASLEEQHVCA